MSNRGFTEKNIEILAPAGSLEVAKGAIEAGADAIYAGLGSMSMRPRRAEFTDNELSDLINHVHEQEKKVYVVANIFPKTSDLNYFKAGLNKIYDMGPDAIVINDLWSLRYVKKHFKDIEAHVSIQASISSDKTAKIYEENGADVIVASRSMPRLEDIKRIREAVKCRIEAFVHGGICFMFDGNCYMSSYFDQEWKHDEEMGADRLYGQNNTKGECHLVCKRTFKHCDNGDELHEGRLMRRPDQVGLSNIPLLVESGVNIFKVEGRAMAKDYVAKAVSLYRRAIESYLENPSSFTVRKEWLPEAKDLEEYRLEYERTWNIK